ncbi:MAG: neutral/alkaline non-lysosomal ceramidase N-terminal domain-containing protein [Phormidesmis sp. FL-bin-119]|nr:neutral/alkaline non-lysosomal ceramidase N-terminal domain-containing protein [Pedobacter sp.]
MKSFKNQSGILKISKGSDGYINLPGRAKSPFFVEIFTSCFSVRCILILLCSIFLMNVQNGYAQPAKIFRAGAATSNITPRIGTSINGNMKDITVKQIHDETHVRCIVLDDGQTRLAILTADLCMIYREQLDEAKQRAQQITGIPIENMMMSATHTHSGGTACSVFQSDPDKEYLKFLTERIADAVVRANNNLVPARIGWDTGSEPTLVFNRRWKQNPVEIKNPFGGIDLLSTNQVEDITDPGLPVISIQTPEGHPIALLANYSLHYVGGTGPGEISADYFGMFAERMKQLVQSDRNMYPPFVAMLSNGTSGNINNVNNKGTRLSLPPYVRMQQVANIVAAEAYKVYQNIKYQDWISLSSVQEEIILGVRLPDRKEIDRAKEIIANAKAPIMDSREEIYARETMLMKDFPKQVPLILQVFRLGDLAIAAAPCEIFVEIGLEIKLKSPFKTTFTTSLANGYNGYLPTPEHHNLGGYETWRARSSYLEVDASTKVTPVLFRLLHKLKNEEISK